MKFGPTDGPIYAIDARVREGYTAAGAISAEALFPLTSEAGAIFARLPFGARSRRRARFEITALAREDYDDLVAYFLASRGSKIRVEWQAAEEVFGTAAPSGPASGYAYLTAATPLDEPAWTASRRAYSIALEMEYAGENDEDEPPGEEAALDFLVEIDLLRGGARVGTTEDLSSIASPVGGMLALVTSTRAVYEYDADSARAGGPGWDYLLTLPENDTSRGFQGAMLRLSCFTDHHEDSPGLDPGYKAGGILEDTLRPPNWSISDAMTGPCIERPEGFTFALRADWALQHLGEDAGLSLHGAPARLYWYDQAAPGGKKILVRSGTIRQATPMRDRVEVEVVPSALGATEPTLSPTITAEDFPHAADNLRGSPVQVTLGRWQRGRLQQLAYDLKTIEVAGGVRMFRVSGYSAGVVTLELSSSALATILGIEDIGDFEPGVQQLWISVVQQDEQPETGKLRRVTGLTDSSGAVTLTVQRAWAVAPTTAAMVSLYLTAVDMRIDAEKCVGFRAPGYLTETAPGGAPEAAPIEVWAEGEGGAPAPVPATLLQPVGAGENRLTVAPEALVPGSPDKLAATDILPVAQSNANPHGLIDARVPGYGTFDFGWSPSGIESGEVRGTPSTSIRSRVLRAAYSHDRVTLVWTEYPGASSYTLRRYLIVPEQRVWVPPRFARTNEYIPGYELVIPELRIPDASWESFGGKAGLTGSSYVDTSVTAGLALKYEYSIESSGVAAIYSNRGVCRALRNDEVTLYAAFGDQKVTICWGLLPAQSLVHIEKRQAGDWTAVSGSPFESSTMTSHVVSGDLTNSTPASVRIRVVSGSYTADGVTWYMPATQLADIPSLRTWLIKPPGQDGDTLAYDHSVYTHARMGVRVRHVPGTTGTDLVGLPAAGVVTAWLLDAPGIDDIASVASVRLLADFVLSSRAVPNSNYGSVARIPVLIRLRGLNAAGRTVFTTSGYRDLTGYDASTYAAGGGTLRFRNLPAALGGAADNVHYDNENTSPNDNGLYTGKDMWKLPEWLFEGEEPAWRRVRWLMFEATNATSVPGTQMRPSQIGYMLVQGAFLADPQFVYAADANRYFLEVERQFTPGTGAGEKPSWIRIDGGRVDPDGTDTGTPGAPIERALDVTRHLVRRVTGTTPLFGHEEFDQQKRWLWRYQSRQLPATEELLKMLAENLHGAWTYTADDKLLLRALRLDIDQVEPVYAFSDANIIRGSLQALAARDADQVFQRFRLRYGVDAVSGGPDHEVVIGHDAGRSRVVLEGYRDVLLDASGSRVEEGSDDDLSELCKLSMRLFGRAARPNEFGAESSPRHYEMFYRPVKSTPAGPVELDLPNLSALWGSGACAPKQSIREHAQMVVQWHFAPGWYGCFDVDVRLLFHHPDVQGKTPVGDGENRIKLGDVVTLSTHRYNRGAVMPCVVLGADVSKWRIGRATVYVFTPYQPSLFGFQDGLWDAGVGARNSDDYDFGDGTFADAGAGDRDTDEHQYPDGTFDDAAR